MITIKKEIIEELSKKLSLHYTGTEQDWEIEMADLNRINDFIMFYKQNDLSVDEKIAVMSLILASYEDFLDKNNLEIDYRWNEIKSALESERMIFFDLVEYWSLGNDVDDIFRITPLVRAVL